MQAFDTLTYQGRARRLRQMALAALAHYDLEVRRVRLITALFNGIFRVDTADGAKYVIRISRPNHRTAHEIQAEALWLAALRRDVRLRVPEPVLNRRGDLVTEVTTPGVPEKRRCVVFSWVPGPNLVVRHSAANLEKLGTFTARLHDHAASFALPADLVVKRFDRVFPYNEAVALFDGPHASALSAEDRARARALVRHAQTLLDRYAASGHPMRLIHADLHQWNIKIHRGELYALDFDDTMFGHPAQDIGIALFYVMLYGEHYAAYRAAFRRGYERVLPWPETHPGEIDTWMAWRAMDLLNAMIQSDIEQDRSFIPYLIRDMQTGLARLGADA